jgi:hypothetical protein
MGEASIPTPADPATPSVRCHRRHLAHRAPGIRPGCTWSTLAILDGQLAQRCALTPMLKTILGALDGPEPPRLFDVTPSPHQLSRRPHPV